MFLLEGQRNEAARLREAVFGEAKRGEFDDVADIEFAFLDNAAERTALLFRSVRGPGQDRFEDCDRRSCGNNGHDNTSDQGILKRSYAYYCKFALLKGTWGVSLRCS